MAWKNLQQLSLADSLTFDYDALTELDDINELMDWEDIEHLLGDIHSKRRGYSAWPPVFMFKALLRFCRKMFIEIEFTYLWAQLSSKGRDFKGATIP
jgi:hypothetical protein